MAEAGKHAWLQALNASPSRDKESKARTKLFQDQDIGRYQSEIIV